MVNNPYTIVIPQGAVYAMIVPVNNSYAIAVTIPAPQSFACIVPGQGQGPKGAAGSSLPWTDLTASAMLATGNNYRANSASLLTLTLPTASFGDPPIFIQGWGTGLWKLLGSGVVLGGAAPYANFTTYVESNDQYDSVWLYPQGGTAYAVAPVGGSLLTSV